MTTDKDKDKDVKKDYVFVPTDDDGNPEHDECEGNYECHNEGCESGGY